MKLLLATALALCAAAASAGADRACIMPGRGHFYIHTGTAGLFGVFAHDHLIEAQTIEGCAVIDSNDLTRSSVKLTFAAAGVRVLDPKEAPADRAKVQTTMETQVLRPSEHPDIIFESTTIERGRSAGTFNVRGSLTIRDKTEMVLIPLSLTRMDDGSYRAAGEYKFNQTRFGIQPIRLAGGAIKVKDEVQTEFELFLK